MDLHQKKPLLSSGFLFYFSRSEQNPYSSPPSVLYKDDCTFTFYTLLHGL